MGQRQVRESSTLDLTLKAVCRSCNTGWLSDLETEFSSAMLPAIGGNPVSLDQQSQQMVATWAAKTWMLLEIALKFDRGWAFQGPGILPFLHRERRPPRELSVWLGGLVPGHSTLAWLTTMIVNEPPVGVITIFTIGNAVFHVYYPFPPVRHSLAIGPNLRAGLTQIWPVAAERVDLPPISLFDIEDMNRMWRTGRIEIGVAK
jgi:hypothetical protein